MSKFTILDEHQVNDITDEMWKIQYECKKWFPSKIHDWIMRDATILGVPDVYVAFPLLVGVAHLSQHARVEVNEYHREPLIIYGLVAGRSGTNKSAALSKICDMIEEIRPNSIFDSGTIDGLAKSLSENKGCVISVNDEFANFVENLDRGTTGNGEKSRILTLYNGSNWSKKTKTSGCFVIEDPRFNLVGFTQPHFLLQFARNPNNLSDGFFQRFLVSVPDEVYIKRKESKNALNESESINMKKIFQIILERCNEKQINLKLSEEAEDAYDEYHDSVVDFRKADRYDNHRVSVKSKSKGLSLRIAGVMSLLRNALKDGDEEVDDLVILSDYQMALEIVNYSVQNSFTLFKKMNGRKEAAVPKKKPEMKKSPIPEPNNMTLDFARANQNFVRRLLERDSIPLSQVTRDKIYPIINGDSGKEVAVKFLKGIEHIGLGCMSPKGKNFKRASPGNEEEKENLKKKLKMFNIDDSSVE